MSLGFWTLGHPKVGGMPGIRAKVRVGHGNELILLLSISVKSMVPGMKTVMILIPSTKSSGLGNPAKAIFTEQRGGEGGGEIT